MIQALARNRHCLHWHVYTQATSHRTTRTATNHRRDRYAPPTRSSLKYTCDTT